MSRRSARNVPPALGKGNLENLTDLKKRKVPAEEVNDKVLASKVAIPSPELPKAKLATKKNPAPIKKSKQIVKPSIEASKKVSSSDESEDSEPQDRKATEPAATAKSQPMKAPATITGGKLTASKSKPKKPATKKRTSTIDDDDSVPSDSSDDGKLNLSKVKKVVDHHARWCPFVRINKKLLRVHRNNRETRALLDTLVSDSDDDGDEGDNERQITEPMEAKTSKAQGAKSKATSSNTANITSSNKQVDEAQAKETEDNQNAVDDDGSEEEVAGASSAPAAITKPSQKKVAFERPAEEGEPAVGGATLRVLSSALLDGSQLPSDSELSSPPESVSNDHFLFSDKGFERSKAHIGGAGKKRAVAEDDDVAVQGEKALKKVKAHDA